MNVDNNPNMPKSQVLGIPNTADNTISLIFYYKLDICLTILTNHPLIYLNLQDI